nr:immunoglobulin heavy chain junction region [Macaca mulatta]MOY24136.1 immunoglobulin heavy chain junction region [Macaca mulatta]MOY24673.1 immunoglobulin heavy chain junction region [Macaca mulatta]MOY24856.1 immunoglobulin heavy chain junction region [Macaca mulatta]MOY25119.1 immunoglobulin heavy chain junction region [Macaca mulatta]
CARYGSNYYRGSFDFW